MKLVTISHPKLPGREVEVPEVSLHHHERAGWKRKSARSKNAASVVDQPAPESKE